MGSAVLRGIRVALIVTVITLLAGMFWTSMGLGGLSMSTLVDIGLISSCIVAGYWTGKISGQWLLGGVAGLGYVILGIILLSLFLEVSRWGTIQVLAEGGLIGTVAGALGAGQGGGNRSPRNWSSLGRSSISAWGRGTSYGDYHLNDWDTPVNDWEDSEVRTDRKNRTGVSEDKESWEEKIQWSLGSKSKYDDYDQDLYDDTPVQRYSSKSSSKQDEWEDWVHEEKKKQASPSPQAWWEEDVL